MPVPVVGKIEDRIVAAARRTEIPTVDLAERELRPADLDAYRREGVLVVRNLISPAELETVASAARDLIQHAWEAPGERDFVAAPFPGSNAPIPFKVDYVMDKHAAFRLLAAHPRLLALASAITGPSFIPTWDTLVLKDAVAGPRLPWHRDCAAYEDCVAVAGSGRVVDVGIYLDASTPENSVRCLPGSCYWPSDVVQAAIELLNGTWDTYPGVAVVVEPGDAVLHNVLTLHSAPETAGSERRVVYYEYRPAELELELGPHTPEYVGIKQRVLRDCLAERQAAVPGEEPFPYDPPPELDRSHGAALGFRIPHSEFWAWTHVPPEPA